MAERLEAQIWIARLSYIGCLFLLLFLSLVPVHFLPSRGADPDLAFCLTAAVVLRRPDVLSIWLVGAMFLFLDILGQRPPGLWAAIMVVTAEFMRLQEYRFRELGLGFEWLFVSGVLFLALLAERAVLAVTMVPLVGFGQVTINFLVTIAVYPLVIGFVAWVLRIRKLSPQDAVRLGHRL